MADVIEVETRIPTGTIPPWNRTESEYVKSYMDSLVRRYDRGIEFEKSELSKISPNALRARQKHEVAIKFWGQTLVQLRDPESKRYHAEEDSARKQYGQVVRKALSTGKDVSEDIINSRLEFRTAKTARERYEKGKHTSFANRSIAINEQMREEQGFKVKRQDGKPITAEQIKEISNGVDEVEKAIGPLHDLFEKTDITIAHTSGKYPFLTGFGGLYTIQEKTVTMGVEGAQALAHEVAHWLDNEAGNAMGVKERVYNKSGKSAITTALSEKGDSIYVGRFQEAGLSLIGKARRSMTDTRLVQQLFRSERSATELTNQKPELAKVKVHLGAYWNRGSEIWARLVEQYVAETLGHKGDSVDSPAVYEKTPGWWSKEEFSKMVPELELEIKKRVRELRGSDIVPPRHKVTPPASIIKQAEAVVEAMKVELPDKQWDDLWEEYIEQMGKHQSSTVDKYSISSLQRLQSYRGMRSVAQDVSKRAKTLIPMRNAKKWLRHPNRSDIAGVDTPARLSR